MSPRHIGVYSVVGACHLCHPDRGWLPRLRWEPAGVSTGPWTYLQAQPTISELPNERERRLRLPAGISALHGRCRGNSSHP